MCERKQGRLKCFNAVKGNGFIGIGDGDGVFIHFSVIQMEGYKKREQGQQIELSIESGPKGLQAANVILI